MTSWVVRFVHRWEGVFIVFGVGIILTILYMYVHGWGFAGV